MHQRDGEVRREREVEGERERGGEREGHKDMGWRGREESE